MSRRHKRIATVLFDLDDTLLDWSTLDQSWEQINSYHLDRIYGFLAAGGYLLPEKHLFQQQYYDVLQQCWDEAKLTWAGVSLARVLKRFFLALDLDLAHIDLDQIVQVYGWSNIPGVAPYEDAIPVLDHLQQADYKLGLVTNSMVPMWMRDIELRHHGLIDYFAARITSGDTGYMKPHPAIYQRALNLLNTLPHQAVFVGDRPANDIAGANEVGLISVWMNPPHLELELGSVVPDFTINHLCELLPILEQLD